jgi:hypothetical protein
MAVKVISWPDLSEQEKTVHYPMAVRAGFGAGTLSNEGVEQKLFPPMRSLESVQIEVTTWCNLGC